MCACVCVCAGVYACAHACVRVRLHVCVCLHVHWVVALYGLISGPDYGHYFPTLVPDTLFSAGGCGAVFYTHETMTPGHVMARAIQLQPASVLCHGCLVGLSGRRTPHATRLACEARQVHSHLSLPVRLSACLSVDHCWEPTAPILVVNFG